MSITAAAPAGRLQIPQEALRKKNVLITRGRFRPFTLLHNDMLMGAAQQFFCDPPADGMFDSTDSVVTGSYDECVYRDDTMVLLELTTRDMMEVNWLLPLISNHAGRSGCSSTLLCVPLVGVYLILGLGGFVRACRSQCWVPAGGQGSGTRPYVDWMEAPHAALLLQNCCPAGEAPGRSLRGHTAAVRLRQWSLLGGSLSCEWLTLGYLPAGRPCPVPAAGGRPPGLDHSGRRHPGGSLPAAHRGPVHHGEPSGLESVGALAAPAPQHGCSLWDVVSRVSQVTPLHLKPSPSYSRSGSLTSSFGMPACCVKRSELLLLLRLSLLLACHSQVHHSWYLMVSCIPPGRG